MMYRPEGITLFLISSNYLLLPITISKISHIINLYISNISIQLNYPIKKVGNSEFSSFKCPNLCKVWISIASLGSINIHKIQSVIPFSHCHCILGQSSHFDLHDSCFKKFIAMELFVNNKSFESRAFQNIGLPSHAFTVGKSFDNNPIHTAHSKSVHTYIVSKPSMILQNIRQLPDLLKSP